LLLVTQTSWMALPDVLKSHSVLGEHHGDLIPDGAGVVGEVLEVMLEVLQGLGPEALVGSGLEGLLDSFRGSLKRLLLGSDGGSRYSKEE
jgi:hypothetical protein